MSYFEKCEDCGLEIKSYDYSVCQPCLKIADFEEWDKINNAKCEICGEPCQPDLSGYYCSDECWLKLIDKAEKKHNLEKLKEAIENKYSKLDNIDLEAAWQASANLIGSYAMKSWHCKPEEEAKYRKLAENAQNEQSEIQKEITRRAPK